MINPNDINSDIVSISIYNSKDCFIHLEESRTKLLSDYVSEVYKDIYKLVKEHEGEHTICETSHKLYIDIWLYSLEREEPRR